MASIGHPLVSDTQYKTKLGKRQLAWCPRLFLHSERVALEDLEGDMLDAEAALPPDLVDVLAAMGDNEDNA